MRRLLTANDELTERNIIRWMTISVPAVVGCTILAIGSTGWARVSFSVAVFTNAIATVCWTRNIVRFLRRLKGPEKEAFLKLYHRLPDITAADNVVETVIVIQEMAKIRKSTFGETREFAFQKAGVFLSAVDNLPLRIPPMWMCTGVLRILNTDLEQLPGYLAHRYDYIRKAASLRLEFLGSTTSRQEVSYGERG